MIEIEAPDGTIVEFPAGTDNATIERAMRQAYGGPAQAEAPVNAVDQAKSNRDKMYGDGLLGKIGKSIGAASDMVGSGLTFGFDDEISAGLSTGFGFLGDYGEAQKRFQARKQATREQNPVASTIGELAGGLTTGGTLAKGGLTLAGRFLPVVGRTGAAALEGAAYGGIYGAGEANQGERLQGAGTGAAVGAVTGGLVSKAGDAVSNALAKRAASRAAPTVEDMQAQAQNLYQTMRNSGVVVKEPALTRLKGNVAIRLKQTTPELAPRAYSLKQLIERDLNGDIGIQDLHNLSKTVNRVAREPLQGEDAYFVGLLKDQVDSAINGLRSSDVKGPVGAIQLKKEADKLWRTSSKAEIIDELFEKAQNQATGFENGLVIQFRALANNKKKMRMFSQEEQAMIKDLVRRGSVRGILRGVGMLSPQSTFGSLVIGGAGVGSGVLPAAALAGVGYSARKGAEAMTRGKADFIRSAVRSGQAPLLQGTQKTVPFIGALSGQSASLPRR